MALRTRLTLVVAVVVAVVLALRAVLQVQVFERRVEGNAHEIVRASASQLADALAELEWPASPQDLHDMVEAIAEQPGLLRVTVLPAPGAHAGGFVEATSGASINGDERALAGEVIGSGAPRNASPTGESTLAAAPVVRQGAVTAVVVVTV